MIRAGTKQWLSTMAILALFLGAGLVMAETKPQPRTTGNPEVSITELELLLKPLPKSQLVVEADAWQTLLQDKAEEIALKEVAIERVNRDVARAEESISLAKSLTAQLEEAKQNQAATAKKDPEHAEKADAEFQESIDKLSEVTSSLAGSKVGVLRDDARPAEEKYPLLASIAESAAEQAEAAQATKVSLLEKVTVLREERTALVDRLRTVLDELESKTDEGDADTLAKVADLRLYSKGVSGIKVDVEDTTSAWIAVKGWLLSDEGGKRWAINFAKFLAILIVAWIISRLLSSAVRHGLNRVEGTSRLLENFLIKGVRWVVMAIGLLMALSALEVSIGPLLAVVGAAGFVIAFALQDSLSNFASGLMILFFRPFDEGDVIEAGGIAGKVQSMNLVSTTILAFDNKRMVVPNNKIWNDVITNATGVAERRVDMQFGIGYDDDIEKAQEILVDIITSHPKVLKEPEPTIRMHALADSSVNFIARPWALTTDYWDVYWDVTRAVKQRFDAAGIGIPFPQRDVHLYIAGGDGKAAASLLSRDKSSTQEVKKDSTVREDGGLDDEDDQ